MSVLAVLVINVLALAATVAQLRWYNKHQRPVDLELASLAAACLETGEKIYEHRYRMRRAADDAEWAAFRAARAKDDSLTVARWNAGYRA